ncbi:MAG: DsrE family protein [Anaerolineales bacterium]|uniref:DsrE family protein n=1 Tax=Candidatus Villigracilis affinis TaxID=3140682 RepID=UPI001D55611D|nr:DsrE family protein [Anaerolineales bacterium]MBK9601294.1 DsrE family protein [Anaerolineales bacterium]
MKDTVILVTNNGMGNAEPALQHKLAAKYFEIIAQNTSLPVAICFYAEGVKLIVTGSPVLKQLKALEEKGVRLIICSTCLDFYNISDQVQLGIVGGMPDIIEAQIKAAKVITI